MALLHIYNHILTFTKFATYSASVVKSNFGNFVGINPSMPPRKRPQISFRLTLPPTLVAGIVKEQVKSFVTGLYPAADEVLDGGVDGR